MSDQCESGGVAVLCESGFPEQSTYASREPYGRDVPNRMDSQATIRVVLLDSQQILLDTLRTRLNNEAGLSVVSALSDTDAGGTSIDELQPDLVILDTDLPGKGVFDFIGETRSRNRQVKFLILSGVFSDVLLAQALQVKVVGYILKSEPVDRLIEIIRQVSQGQTYYSAPVQSRICQDPVRNVPMVKTEQAAADLTARQLEVLRHLARGSSVKEVAKLMHLSQKSVDSHKYRIMNKLGIHDRVDLTRYAIRERLIEA
jgi:DNA-binding NarL/FixJ family response regulator